MSETLERRPILTTSLRGLRLRLTAWYAGTILVILTLLGIGVFAAITQRFDADLDASLRDASAHLAGVAQERGVTEAPRALRVPDRHLLVYSAGGALLASDSALTEPWVGEVASRAARAGTASASHGVGADRILRAQARAFRAGRDTYVAVAVADEVELEDRYTTLIAAFGAAALFAVVLGSAGGWFVARQSTRPVERAIDHMRQFMADAAHELRTPITVVRSRAEIALQRSRNPEDYTEALLGIEHEAERLGRIVEDLLTLARADSGERPIERARVFLDDITLDAATAARAIADRKGVRLDVGAFDEAPVAGDPALLRQLVLILLDNAVKFTGAGGEVRVDVESVNGQPTLRVADTGCGIPPDQLPRIFERFFRGDPARTRGSGDAAQGAGLGLSIARWIADAHDARIDVASEAGQGTRVAVHFPPADSASLSFS
ncbi:MAG TPA: HAMP domain-containing sensor histidine kinase [Gemmatimonadaceae bacterium]|nr:HAMP domain-containing sensor histidine kinase [Gemmatimonadaceae bacterium]